MVRLSRSRHPPGLQVDSLCPCLLIPFSLCPLVSLSSRPLASRTNTVLTINRQPQRLPRPLQAFHRARQAERRRVWRRRRQPVVRSECPRVHQLERQALLQQLHHHCRARRVPLHPVRHAYLVLPHIHITLSAELKHDSGFMSNGTYGAGGVANYESISSIYGMQTNEDGSICYVPERFPENWYRRAVPYGVADLVAGLAPTYLTGPELTLPNPAGILQNPGQTGEIGCALYQGLTSGIPAALLGQANDQVSSALTFLTNNLRLPVSSTLLSSVRVSKLMFRPCTAATLLSRLWPPTRPAAGSMTYSKRLEARATAISAPKFATLDYDINPPTQAHKAKGRNESESRTLYHSGENGNMRRM